MIFGISKTRMKDVMLDDTVLEEVSETKVLGVIINNKFSRVEQIHNVKNKVTSSFMHYTE